MVQQGRGFRAAQPRGNLTNLPYSNRMPYRWDVSASMRWAGHYDVETVRPCHAVQTGYDGSTATWRWEGHTTWNGSPVTFKVSFGEGLPDGHRLFVVRLELPPSDFWQWSYDIPWHVVVLRAGQLWPAIVNVPTETHGGSLWVTGGNFQFPVDYASEP